ncbi:MAG: cob(I)yrinic acid a,c-diamide adenosyltransferase [Pseudomonadales bacterium]|nr:cob(I)yrinic acid a,c-diamide adenosyltransferase [Pseudomonadales bacterium]
MKHRITRVTTRGGDAGQTMLADGSRVGKTDPQIEAIGTVDELNSFLGVLIAEIGEASPFTAFCRQVQQDLFDLGALLATRGATPPPALDALETEVARLNDALPPLTEFVLPGGTRAASAAHVCRTVCRRAERTLWALDDTALPCARYLNRLSDFFFVLARCLNAGQVELQWRGSSARGSSARGSKKQAPDITE